MADDLGRQLRDLPIDRRAELEERLLRSLTPAMDAGIVPRWSGSGPAPLGLAQQRVWFLDQLDPGSPVYNISRRIRLQGPLNVPALRTSLAALVARHQTLRTRFLALPEGPRQVIDPPFEPALDVIDLGSWTAEEREAEGRRLAVEEARRGFDLAAGPLLRTILVRLADEDHLLLLTVHHIVTDVWSMGVLFRELGTLYGAFVRGEPSPLPELPIQYVDYAVWQSERLRGERLERELAWWRERLRGAPAALDLPTDHARPALRSGRGAKQSATLRPEVRDALVALCRRQQVTLFAALLAAYQTLLLRYTGQDDIVVGVPTAGRTRPETEGLIGLFVNTLALRTDLSGDPTFRELLGRVREVALAADAHQDLPFEKLVEELQPERDLGRTPVVQVGFALQNVPRQKRELAGLLLRSEGADSGTAKFDLMLYTWEQAGGIRMVLEYSTDLFDAETAGRLLDHLRVLVEGAVAEPDRRLSELPLLPPDERTRLVREWNATAADFPRDATVGTLFAAQAALTPDAPALLAESARLSYRELDEASNRLARHLQAHGVGPEVKVGLCLERSPDLVVAILSILKAGGCYVPLDPQYPADRIRFMLADASVDLVVTDSTLLDRTASAAGRIICLDRDAATIRSRSEARVDGAAAADNLVYAMYTSGSTGVPKAVAVTHRAVIRLVRNSDYFDTGPGEIFLLLSNISFDVSTFELWGPLLNGGCLAVAPPAPLSLEEIGRAIRAHGVTRLWLTAGLFHVMVEERLADLGGLRQLLAGGDVLAPEHVARAVQALRGCRITNGYGPTEATTFACCHDVAESEVLATVPIGRPIGNTTAFVLDRHLHPAPIGVPGELYLGGPGVARGYLGRPGLTAERFVPDPFAGESGAEPGGRLYRTGDQARRRGDGTLEFLGRLDHQVKIRGFRVEPGEVEAVLATHPAVRSALVLVTTGAEPGGKRLIAYLIPTGDIPAPGMLRGYLRERLPDFMVPSRFIPVEVWPLSPSGKVDRRALPSPDRPSPTTEREWAPPRTPLEARLAEVWSEVLRVDRVGVHDSFFELGGHSLLATQLVSRVRAALGIELPLRTLFESPTVAGVASRVRSSAAPEAAGSPPLARIARSTGLLPQPGPVDPARAIAQADGPGQGHSGDPHLSDQERLASIWAAVLRIEHVGVDDDFFSLGGHSLLATQVISRVREAFGVELPLRALFDRPTVAGLAQLLVPVPSDRRGRHGTHDDGGRRE